MNKSLVSIMCCSVLASSLFANNDKVYAIVNGEKITESAFAVVLANQQKKFSDLSQDEQKNLLKKIIDKKVLSQYALKDKAVVNNKTFKDTLKNFKEDLALQVWMRNVSQDIQITDVELKKFYDENKNLFKQDTQYKARHILVETEKEAQALIKELKSTTSLQAKFIQLAKEKSTGPSGKNGGDLGWFGANMMVPEFGKALEDMKIGSLSAKPVQTNFGFHIIYLEDKKNPSIESFDDAKNKIKQQIGQQKFVKFVEEKVNEQTNKAKIEYK